MIHDVLCGVEVSDDVFNYEDVESSVDAYRECNVIGAVVTKQNWNKGFIQN